MTQSISSSSPLPSSCDNSNNNCSILALLTPELWLEIADWLPVRELCLLENSICLQVSRHLTARSEATDAIWKRLCAHAWQNWPRYRLTEGRETELDQKYPNTTWKQRCRLVHSDATRSTLQYSDLTQLSWHLSFVLSGIRGEGRSDHVPAVFVREAADDDEEEEEEEEQEAHAQFWLRVPGYPPLPYQIVNEAPPVVAESRIRANLRGDQPFSRQQWLRIANFPSHFICRQRSTAEWLIVNEAVVIVSSGDGS